MTDDAVPTPARPALLVSSLAVLATFIAAAYTIERHDLPVALRVLLVALPFVSFAWFLIEEVRFIRRLDELEQRIQLEALAVAYPLAILLLLGVGLLERAQVAVPGFTRPRDLWALAVLPYALGLWLGRRRYR